MREDDQRGGATRDTKIPRQTKRTDHHVSFCDVAWVATGETCRAHGCASLKAMKLCRKQRAVDLIGINRTRPNGINF
jgi:hypothetical protein